MTLLKTQLHSWHIERAKMVTFAGFEMPVVYNLPSNISKEHLAVRNYAGIFDVSHMGRAIVSGKDAVKFLNILIPRDLSVLPQNKVAYCYFLNERGGFRDDITVAYFDHEQYMLTYNAGNRLKIWSWIKEIELLVKNMTDMEFTIENISDNTAMFAFQGPKTPEIIESLFGSFPEPWKSLMTKYSGKDVLIMGTGYTGESGYEIVVFNASMENINEVIQIWEDIIKFDVNIVPCGLGARDTLRLEAGMHLYGNDIGENISAVQSGLVFPALVKLDKDYFIGKSSIEADLADPNIPKRVGLITVKRGRSPRAGMKILFNNEEIGKVTSGSFSPLLKLGIGMGYVKNIDQLDKVTLRTEKFDIIVDVVKFPLFDPKKYGSKRMHS